MSSTIPETQKILVHLSEPDILAEPGTVAKLTVQITNRQSTPDRMLVEIEGIDLEWYNIPVAAVNLAPGAQGEVRINIRIMRSSSNIAGSYPFLVRVQAMETGETGMAQAMLMVKPFSALETDMQPRRAASTFLHPLQDFEVQVTNLGNTEQTAELTASDPDDECAFEFDVDRITLKPGETVTIPLAVRPKVVRWLGNSRIFGFSVWARAADDAYISSKTQGQLERYALLSPALGVLLLLLALGAGGFALFRPRPPVPIRITALTATPAALVSGGPITLSWDVQGDYNKFTLSHTENQSVIFDNMPRPYEASGNTLLHTDTVSLPTVAHYTLTVSGRGGRQSRTVDVQLIPAPALPHPALSSFTADSTEIHLGETVTFSWKAANSSGFILDPGDHKLSEYVASTSLVPQPVTLPSQVTYTLRAMPLQGSSAPPASRTLRITVVSPSASVADIQGFHVSNAHAYLGDTVELRWSTLRTQNVTITDGSNNVIGSNLPAAGHVSVTLNGPVSYTLTAADNLNKTVSRTISLNPQPRPAAPVVTPPASPGAVPPGGAANPTGGSPAQPATTPGK